MCSQQETQLLHEVIFKFADLIRMQQLEKCVCVLFGKGQDSVHREKQSTKCISISLFRSSRHMQNIYSYSIPPVTDRNVSHRSPTRIRELARQAYRTAGQIGSDILTKTWSINTIQQLANSLCNTQVSREHRIMITLDEHPALARWHHELRSCQGCATTPRSTRQIYG